MVFAKINAIEEETLRQRFNIDTYPRVLYWDAGFTGGERVRG